MRWNWTLHWRCDPKGRYRVMRFYSEQGHCFELLIDLTKQKFVAVWTDTNDRRDNREIKWKYFEKPIKNLRDAVNKAINYI